MHVNPNGLVTVKLTRRGVGQNNKGEICGFTPPIAQALVNLGDAVFVTQEGGEEPVISLEAMSLDELRDYAITVLGGERVSELAASPAALGRGGQRAFQRMLLDELHRAKRTQEADRES